MIKSRFFLKKTTFHPTKFVFEKTEDGHSKRERMEIIDLNI